jgi:hypothetical protein
MVDPHRSSRSGGFLHPTLQRSAPTRRNGSTRGLAWLALAPLALIVAPVATRAQQSGYGQTMGSTPAESQIYNYDPGSGNRTGSSSEGLNPANPLDLINKIRKGSAMDNATPPGDAVDQALKELEAQSRPQAATSSVSPVGTSPRPSAGGGATP